MKLLSGNRVTLRAIKDILPSTRNLLYARSAGLFRVRQPSPGGSGKRRDSSRHARLEFGCGGGGDALWAEKV